ncbi:hypothetical protein INT43_008287, partial [Umbelopsis isabellina]
MTSKKQQSTPAEEEEEEEELCFICTEPVATFAVAECNHRTCHICSLRLRALYKTRNCAYCKTEQKSVIFTKDPKKLFQEYTQDDTPLVDKHLNIRFEDQQTFQDSMILLQFNCPEPTCEVNCPGGWSELKRHVKKEHERLLCDLCTRYKKIFVHEQTLFQPSDLKKHYRFGDKAINKEDDSGFKGHPECAFCRSAFYGDDELFEHCRDKHEQCHICVRRGKRHEYYANYDQLAEHFNRDHYMCQWRDCLDKKFIVFESDIDLKAHEVEVHGSSGGRVQRARQMEARKVDVTFEYSGGRQSRNDRNKRDNQRETSQKDSADKSRSQEEFPQIGAESSRMQQLNIGSTQPNEDTRNKSKSKSTKGMKKPAGFGSLSQGNDWPELGQKATPPAIGTTNKPQVDAPVETVQKHTALLDKLAEYVNGDQARVERFRQLTSSYRKSNIDGKSYIDQVFKLLNSNMDQASRIIRGVEELLDDTSKKAEIVRYWRDKRTSLESFPSLAPSTAAQKTSVSNPSQRVLVIKSGNTRRGGTKTKTSKTNVWDKVAHAAAATPKASHITPPSSRPESPARSANMSRTPWSTGGAQTTSRPSASSSSGPTVRRVENDFPSLPPAPPKNQLIVEMRRSNSAGDPATRGWGKEPDSGEEATGEDEPKPVGKKGKKKGKQVLFRVG